MATCPDQAWDLDHNINTSSNKGNTNKNEYRFKKKVMTKVGLIPWRLPANALPMRWNAMGNTWVNSKFKSTPFKGGHRRTESNRCGIWHLLHLARFGPKIVPPLSPIFALFEGSKDFFGEFLHILRLIWILSLQAAPTTRTRPATVQAWTQTRFRTRKFSRNVICIQLWGHHSLARCTFVYSILEVGRIMNSVRTLLNTHWTLGLRLGAMGAWYCNQLSLPDWLGQYRYY